MTDPIGFDVQYGWMAGGTLPVECIEDCSASGDVESDVQWWREHLNFTDALRPVDVLARQYLSEYSAWDDLETADLETIADRVLWCACCDQSQEGEPWLGLVH